ncbi:MAG: hypothetical protein C5B60_00765 [Chloroflexi bacterium]|nr:MAG: hypothetical protein C5B60_00765 [Chloroflexota bacterium]
MKSETGPRHFPIEGKDDPLAYQEGYSRTLREFAWAREHGFIPSERLLVLALVQANRIYDTVRGGKSVGGRQPEWLHGRADALRTLLVHGPAESGDYRETPP